MKKVGDLFAELGFREDGSDSVKRAFIENLVKAAGGEASRRANTFEDTFKPAVKTSPGSVPPRSSKLAKNAAVARDGQLSFDFSDEPETPLFPLTPKRSAG